MTAVSLLEFRKDAGGVLNRVRRGQSLLLTVRGKPVARLEPVKRKAGPEDPLYRLADLAAEDGVSLSNAEMDRGIYGA
ncbi:MAG: type II toxin-antitoxin system prevent-host-death family antitoxin [Kiritimatiellae bacterium]|nr:type II toxin-antitoxin system prevent-host-death family antitoxin [Kiritimatiellia bacterium]